MREEELILDVFVLFWYLSGQVVHRVLFMCGKAWGLDMTGLMNIYLWRDLSQNDCSYCYASDYDLASFLCLIISPYLSLMEAHHTACCSLILNLSETFIYYNCWDCDRGVWCNIYHQCLLELAMCIDFINRAQIIVLLISGVLRSYFADNTPNHFLYVPNFNFGSC